MDQRLLQQMNGLLVCFVLYVSVLLLSVSVHICVVGCVCKSGFSLNHVFGTSALFPITGRHFHKVRVQLILGICFVPLDQVRRRLVRIFALLLLRTTAGLIHAVSRLFRAVQHAVCFVVLHLELLIVRCVWLCNGPFGTGIKTNKESGWEMEMQKKRLVIGEWNAHLILQIHELRLDRGGVDALIVEELFYFLGDLHVVVQVVASDVSRGDDPIPGQLPHMELVHRQHTIDLTACPYLRVFE